MKKLLIIVFLIVFMASNSLVAFAKPFPELEGYWAEKDITLLNKKEIVKGFPDGFHPDDKVTRAQLGVMLIKALEQERDIEALQKAKSSFQDVSYTYWAKAYIQLASELKLIQGYTKSEFRPEEALRRDQLAVILMRTLELVNPGQGIELDFTDKQTIPSYALPYIKEAVKRGIVMGYPDGNFRPEETVTRAQLSAMLKRWLNVKGADFDLYGKITGSDQLARQIKVATSSGEEVFDLSQDVDIVASNGQELKEGDIQAGVKAYFILDNENLISYIQVQEAEAVNEVNINLNSRTLAKPVELKDEDNQVTALFNPRKPLSKGNPQVSLEATKAEINANSLNQITGADGSEQTIAIIDTGLDVGHPDLWWNNNQQPKVVDYFDLTDEGLVVTDKKVVPVLNQIVLEDRTYKIGDIKSKSGQVTFGYIYTETLLPQSLLDKNDEGEIVGERIGVLLVDSEIGGTYDTVYVDLNRDIDFSNERGYKLYKYDQSILELPKSGILFKFVVADLDSKGGYVRFGFDVNGHGTHVAGIAAANGKIQGVAPQAQLMIIKAIDSDGFSDWDSIKKGIVYAAENGANIINLSLGQYQHLLPGGSELARVVNEMTLKHNVLFTIASGNTGPGLNSLATPADADKAIAVGAYVSPRMWETDFGWTVEKESLWYFSSLGPRKDGAWFPTVVAPGSAISTIPTWGGGDYHLLEGTSMAAPHVAGGIALLLDAAQRNNIEVNPEIVKQAVELGARELPHFQPAEEGHGVFDTLGAWNMLQKIKVSPAITTKTFNHLYEVGRNVFAREYEPAQLNLYIDGESTVSRIINWQSDVDWLKPKITEMILPEGGLSRGLPVEYKLPDQPGLYSTILKGDDPSTPWLDTEVLATIIKPVKLDASKDNTFVQMDSLDSAQYKRYYVRVPEGASELRTSLEVYPDTSGKYQGRARIHLVTPHGEEVKMTNYAGYGPPGYNVQGKVEAVQEAPEAGTWEIVVYSSATLSLYDEQQSQYQIKIQLDTPEERSNQEFINQYMITVLPKDIIKDEINYITIQIRDREDKKLLKGIVEIEGKVFQVNNGKILYPIKPTEDSYTLNVTVLE